MFNRTFQIRMIKAKKNKGEQEDILEDDKAVQVTIVNETAKTVTQELTKLVASYIVLDTGRKVLIALVSK